MQPTEPRINLRQLFGVDDEYATYCREERNFAAVLYHYLLDPDLLKVFLDNLGYDVDSTESVRVYFEYAHLRDIWHRVSQTTDKREKDLNAQYRQAILSMLGAVTLRADSPLSSDDIATFNGFFVDRPSSRQIQMPGRWSKSKFGGWFEEGEDFARRACFLRWAFNAKPDLVLHIGNDRAICIEAKLESGLDTYSVKHPEKSISANQIEVQEVIFELLGLSTEFVLLSNRESKSISTKVRQLRWADVFSWFPSELAGSNTAGSFRESELIGNAL